MQRNVSREETPKRLSPHPLQRERVIRNWSQQDLADKLGTTFGNVSRWERRITSPSAYYRQKLCDLFGKDAHALGLLEAEEESHHILRDESDELLFEAAHRLSDPAIPTPATGDMGLVGRSTLLKQIKGQLTAGNSLALHGLPGVGKTALALALLNDKQIRATFRDGVLWAGLGPTPSLPAILSRWSMLLGILSEGAAQPYQQETLSQRANAIRTAIGTRRLLLIIDDAWKLEDIMALTVGGAGCVYLLTTRFPQIAASFALRGATHVPELNEDEGMELLTCLTPEIVNEDQATARSLVWSVGALPLALTLMGKYLHVQMYRSADHRRRVRETVAQLRDAEQRLRLSEPTSLVDHPPSLQSGLPISLHSMIAVSDQQLDDQTRSALYALSVLPAKPESFSEETALAVSGKTQRELDRLHDAGLLEWAGLERSTLHQTIADYARLHLKDAAPWKRLIAYSARYAEKYQQSYTRLERESGMILAGLETAYRLGRRVELVRGVHHFVPFLLARGLYTQAEQFLQRAHEAAIYLGDTAEVIYCAFQLGKIAEKQGNYTQAVAALQKAWTVARHSGTAEARCRVLMGLGVLTQRQGNTAQAEEHFREGLALARSMKDHTQACTFLINLGTLTQARGEYKQAEQYYREGLQHAQMLEEREYSCMLLLHLGDITMLRGATKQANAYYQEGIQLTRTLGERGIKGGFLLGVEEDIETSKDVDPGEAIVQEKNIQNSADFEQANAAFQNRLTLAHHIGYRELMCRFLTGLAGIAMSQGDDEAAANYYSEGLPLAHEAGDRERYGIFAFNMGEIALRQGKKKQAASYYKEALDVARQMDHTDRIILVLLKLGEASIDRKDDDTAEPYLQDGLNLALQANNRRCIYQAYTLWGEYYLKRRQKEAAATSFYKVLSDVPPHCEDLVATAWYGLARISAAKGDYEEACKHAEASLAIFEHLGHRDTRRVLKFLRMLAEERER